MKRQTTLRAASATSDRVTRRREAVDAAVAERDAAIRAAHADGWTLREIEEATGLTFSMVGRIVRAAGEETR